MNATTTRRETPLLFTGEMIRAIRRANKPKRVTRRDAPSDPADRPHGDVGDRVWAKENYRLPVQFDNVKPSDVPVGTVIRFEADGEVYGAGHKPVGYAPLRGFGKLRPSLFMCRWMARIVVELTAVSVERLHEITDADALLEGVHEVQGTVAPYYCVGDHEALTPALAYALLWDEINGAGEWDKNPLVMRLAFKPASP